MNRTWLSLCLLAATTSGCTGARQAPEAVVTEARAPAARASAAEAPAGSAASAPEASGPREAAAPRTVPRDGGAAAELALWSDPEFKRRFVESYLAETDIEPSVPAPERESLQKAYDFMASDHADRALAFLEDPKLVATSAAFDTLRANLYFQRERLDDAAVAYEAAIAKFPKYRRAWKNLALVYVKRGEFEAAARAFTRVIELGGSDAVTYGLLGFVHANLGNHLAAESAYRMAALLDPATPDWKTGLARSFFKQERYPEAVALLGNLLAEDPERADLWLLQANAYLGLERPLDAAQNLEIAGRLAAPSADSLNMLGDIYVNAELFELGVGAYVRALEEHPESDPTRALRAANVLRARGALDEARRLAERVETLRGGSGPAGVRRLADGERKDLLKLQARLAAAEGAGDEEARVLEEIVALDPLDGEALILLGQHEGRAKNIEKAIFLFERAASLEPFEAEAKMRHAQLLVGERRYAEALPLLRRAQTLKPNDNLRKYLEDVEKADQTR